MKKYIFPVIIGILTLIHSSHAVEVKPQSTRSGATVKITRVEKPFMLGNIQYTIHSLRTFDKVGEQDSYSDYKYPKNGAFVMVELSYKNMQKKGDKSPGTISLIDGEKQYTPNFEGGYYGKVQMNWGDEDNFGSYIPPGIKKRIFVSFDVPLSVLKKGVFYISDYNGEYKKIEVKIPLSTLK